VNIIEIVLHVNWGTFKPIRTEDITKHNMLPEDYEVDTAQAEIINRTKNNGRKVFAVGTSVVRTLETLCTNDGKIEPGKGQTDLYIYPGYKFKIIDGLLTNFHLPKTTPFVLVCAFCGTEKIRFAYRTAIEKKYRFYSYGDAMLII
jgi:S-adenosylmethionine:tRNA ribosyltransferase-isomerase